METSIGTIKHPLRTLCSAEPQALLLTEDDINGERRLVPAPRVHSYVGSIIHAGDRRADCPLSAETVNFCVPRHPQELGA